MANTYIDPLVEYPAKFLSTIASDKKVLGFLLNKPFDEVTEDDVDEALDEKIFSYQYVDDTVTEEGCFIWAELEIPRVQNKQIMSTNLYVTVACHRGLMKLDSKKFPGVMGNRRDNLARYIDRLLNEKYFAGIGALKLTSVKTLTSYNGFTFRELAYEVPDFNVADKLVD